MGGFRFRCITTLTCEANGVPNTDALPSLTDVSHLRSLPNGIVSLLASHRIHLASMSTAQVSSPIIASRGSRARFIGAATMSKSRACRQLFPTSEEERQEQERIPESVQEELETTQDNQSRRWNFDFKRGIPKPGSPWEAVAEEQVPQFYRSVAVQSRSPRRHIRRGIHGLVLSARTSESPDRHQSNDNSISSNGLSSCASNVVSAIDNPGPSAAAPSADERVRVQHPLDNTDASSNSQSQGLPTAPSTIPIRNRTVQRQITEFLHQRKRTRSESDASDSSAKMRRTCLAPLERPRSAPASVATSS